MKDLDRLELEMSLQD